MTIADSIVDDNLDGHASRSITEASDPKSDIGSDLTIETPMDVTLLHGKPEREEYDQRHADTEQWDALEETSACRASDPKPLEVLSEWPKKTRLGQEEGSREPDLKAGMESETEKTESANPLVGRKTSALTPKVRCGASQRVLEINFCISNQRTQILCPYPYVVYP